jgi:hypothetical protein
MQQKPEWILEKARVSSSIRDRATMTCDIADQMGSNFIMPLSWLLQRTFF